jgi:hypothetical protein
MTAVTFLAAAAMAFAISFCAAAAAADLGTRAPDTTTVTRESREISDWEPIEEAALGRMLFVAAELAHRTRGHANTSRLQCVGPACLRTAPLTTAICTRWSRFGSEWNCWPHPHPQHPQHPQPTAGIAMRKFEVVCQCHAHPEDSTVVPASCVLEYRALFVPVTVSDLDWRLMGAVTLTVLLSFSVLSFCCCGSVDPFRGSPSCPNPRSSTASSSPSSSDRSADTRPRDTEDVARRAASLAESTETKHATPATGARPHRIPAPARSANANAARALADVAAI